MYFAQNSTSNSLETIIHFIDEIKKANRQEYLDFVTELIEDAKIIIQDDDLANLKSRSISMASYIAMKHPEFILSIQDNSLSHLQLDEFQNLLKEDIAESVI